MKKKTSEERFILATESIAKSLEVMADARKDDQKNMAEVVKILMPVLKRVARETARPVRSGAKR